MTSFVVFAVIAAIAVLQTTWLSGLAVAGVQPDIALLLIAWHANRTGAQRGQVVAFATGVVEDLLSVAPLGYHAFIRLWTGFLLGLTQDQVRVDAVVTPVVLAAVGTAISVLARLIGTALVTGGDAFPELRSTLILAAMNVVLAPIVFGIASRIAAPSGRSR